MYIFFLLNSYSYTKTGKGIHRNLFLLPSMLQFVYKKKLINWGEMSNLAEIVVEWHK